MVAPLSVGEPVRSLVRVPTKSWTTTTLCWDISRSSPVAAAAAPLHQPLQATLVLPQNPAAQSTKPSPEQAANPGTQPPVSQEPLPQPPAQQQAAPTPCEPKRPREEEEEGAEGTPQPVLKVARTARPPEAAPSSPPQPLANSTPDPGTHSPQSQQDLEKEVQRLRQLCQSLQQQNEVLQKCLADSASPEPQQSRVQYLQQACHSLNQQKEELQRRLDLFHGLFRDKQRLVSFVKHLDTVVG